MKEFIRILCDHSKAPREEMTEMVEDHICGLQPEDDEYVHLVQVSFDYPGSKDAIVEFRNVVANATIE